MSVLFKVDLVGDCGNVQRLEMVFTKMVTGAIVIDILLCLVYGGVNTPFHQNRPGPFQTLQEFNAEQASKNANVFACLNNLKSDLQRYGYQVNIVELDPSLTAVHDNKKQASMQVSITNNPLGAEAFKQMMRRIILVQLDTLRNYLMAQRPKM